MKNFDEVPVEDFLEDDLEVLDFVDMGYPGRIFLRPNCHEEMSKKDFSRRLTKPTVMTLLIVIESQLEYPDHRNNSLSPMNQLLLTLRFFASSGHMIQMTDFRNVHVSTVSRVIALCITTNDISTPQSCKYAPFSPRLRIFENL
ncbi:hypothetical protein JTB14_031176 [Gonioctena quinquepunctata]|nr:hypothetical protein JTB14_031176 [Gonioctena quinquepunctata]